MEIKPKREFQKLNYGWLCSTEKTWVNWCQIETVRRFEKKKKQCFKCLSPPLFSVKSRCKIPEIEGLTLAFVYNFIYLVIFKLKFKVVDFVCFMTRLKRTPYEFYWLNFSTHKQCSSLVKVSWHRWIGQASLMTCNACGICQLGEVN